MGLSIYSLSPLVKDIVYKKQKIPKPLPGGAKEALNNSIENYSVLP
jgi:hypothetical protein